MAKGFGIKKDVSIMPKLKEEPEQPKERIGFFAEITPDTKTKIDELQFFTKRLSGMEKITLGELLDKIIEEYWSNHPELHLPDPQG